MGKDTQPCAGAAPLALLAPRGWPQSRPRQLAASTRTVKRLKLPAQESTLFALKGGEKKIWKKGPLGDLVRLSQHTKLLNNG